MLIPYILLCLLAALRLQITQWHVEAFFAGKMSYKAKFEVSSPYDYENEASHSCLFSYYVKWFFLWLSVMLWYCHTNDGNPLYMFFALGAVSGLMMFGWALWTAFTCSFLLNRDLPEESLAAPVLIGLCLFFTSGFMAGICA